MAEHDELDKDKEIWDGAYGDEDDDDAYRSQLMDLMMLMNSLN